MPRRGCAGPALTAVLAWLCATAAWPVPAHAEASVEFDIASQPMAAALNAWAVQANTQVFVDPGPVAHLIAPAIKGSLTPRQALRALLARSRLQVSQGTNGVFVIKPRPAAVVAQQAPATQSATPVAPPVATLARAPLTARASEGPWLLGLLADYARDNGRATGGATAAVAGEYFVTDHAAAALAITLPRTHSFEVPASAAAAPHRASARLQSSAMTLKYHFAPEDRWDPYLGAGFDVTVLSAAHGAASLDRVTAGPAAEAGINLRLNRQWMFNATLSWAQVQPAVGVMPSQDIRIDPVQCGFGFVYRF
ncbi:MAG TPA: OmpW family outer membrane protein [Steroidobacteraceae bacterium]